MGREERLTRPQQYASVYRKGSSQVSGLLVMRALPNDLVLTRYGLSVSKRVGKAVTRNRLKRRMREIMRETPLKAGWDIVFIVRPAASEASYVSLKETVERLLSKNNLLITGEEEGHLEKGEGI